MILKASQRGGARELSAHLLNVTENEHVELHDVRGFMATTLAEALEEIYAVSRGTKCRQYMFAVSLSPPPEAQVTVADFEKALARMEEKLGLQSQPRVVVFHEKKGRRHAHCVWSRIDARTMTAIPMPYFKFKLRDLSRALFLEHGWKLPRGLEQGRYGNPLNFTLAEWQQAQRHGEDPQAIKAQLQRCWHGTQSGKAFAAELESKGYFLARGDRRGFVAVDWRGEVYSLTRWLGVNGRQIKDRLGEAHALAPVVEVKARIAKIMTARLKDFQRDMDGKARDMTAKIVKDRETMVVRHREERKTLYAAIDKRQSEETRMRAERMPKGLRAVWAFVTGKYQRLRRQNEAETALCLARDRAEKHTLVTAQLKERATLQKQMRVWRDRHWQKTALLKQDIAFYLTFAADKEQPERDAVAHKGRMEQDVPEPMRPPAGRGDKENQREVHER
ncbi:MAG: relaxase/mobilization nuclease domain-containing protein [Rhodospirillales bacterium]|nr:relaxase/mobilization nuclease domain-containing protein [Rhodospirillales bacterium]